MENPPVIRKASPRAIIMMARVVMNGATLNCATIQPPTPPTTPQASVPATNPSSTTHADAAGPPSCCMTSVAITADKRDQTADRQVNAAGDNHHRHADGNHGDHDDPVDDRQQVRAFEKVGPQPRLRASAVGSSADAG